MKQLEMVIEYIKGKRKAYLNIDYTILPPKKNKKSMDYAQFENFAGNPSYSSVQFVLSSYINSSTNAWIIDTCKVGTCVIILGLSAVLKEML